MYVTPLKAMHDIATYIGPRPPPVYGLYAVWGPVGPLRKCPFCQRRISFDLVRIFEPGAARIFSLNFGQQEVLS